MEVGNEGKNFFNFRIAKFSSKNYSYHRHYLAAILDVGREEVERGKENGPLNS